MSDWIAVSEKMPDESGNYLIFNDKGLIISYYAKDNYGWAYFKVTHWQNLPQPPDTQ